METMAGMHRSCGCGHVTELDYGKELTLAGWVNTRRDHGGLIFIDLRDRSGIVQLVMSPQYGEEAFLHAFQFPSAEWGCIKTSFLSKWGVCQNVDNAVV